MGWLSVKEAADYLGCSESKIRKDIMNSCGVGRLFYKIDGMVRVNREDIDGYAINGIHMNGPKFRYYLNLCIKKGEDTSSGIGMNADALFMEYFENEDEFGKKCAVKFVNSLLWALAEQFDCFGEKLLMYKESERFFEFKD